MLNLASAPWTPPPPKALPYPDDPTSMSMKFLSWKRAAWPRATALGLIALCGALLFVGCGGDDGESQGDKIDGEDAGQDDISLDPSGDGDASNDGMGLVDDGTCSGLVVGGSCEGEVYEGEAVPLDLYLMFDQSGSMATVVDKSSGTTRMEIVRTAISAFLKDSESVGMGAGIGYFGHQPLGDTTCDVAEYKEPDVGIASLPQAEKALLDSVLARMPTGETPTGSAIRGACEYVADYRVENPGRNPVILLVTDGEPKAPLSEEVCAPTLDDAVAAAEECFQQKNVRVYVLGVGPSLTNLRVIAEAGGTEQAYLADLDNAQQVLDAFRAVRYAAQLPCDLKLSEAATLGDGVNTNDSTVAYLDIDCEYQAVSKVSNQGACGENSGWYFDDPDAPTTIHLCDVTCGEVKSRGRQLFYSLGCPLEVVR